MGQFGHEAVALYGVQILDEDICVKLQLVGEPGQCVTLDETRLSNVVLEGKALVADSIGMRSFELSDDQLSLAADMHGQVLALF